MGSPGRPAVGPMITLRLTPEDLVAIDEDAAARGISRAEWLRRAAGDFLEAVPRDELAELVPWLIEQQVEASEIGRLISKPWQYTSWRAARILGIDLYDLEEWETDEEGNFRFARANTLGEAVAILREAMAHG